MQPRPSRFAVGRHRTQLLRWGLSFLPRSSPVYVHICTHVPLPHRRAWLTPSPTTTTTTQVASFVNTARGEGAEVVAGGKRPEYLDESLAEGYYYEPTVIANVKPSMQVVQEEVFGPVVVAYSFEDEVHTNAHTHKHTHAHAAALTQSPSLALSLRRTPFDWPMTPLMASLRQCGPVM